MALGEAELLKGDTGSDLDLCSDDIDAGDLLYEMLAYPHKQEVIHR